MFYTILDQKRLEILPFFKVFKKDFYLAGETGLALQEGHRDSIDFDFFTPREFSPPQTFEILQKTFSSRSLLKVQEEKNTLTVFLDNTIKISFFSYPYPLLEPLLNEPYIRLARLKDLACMKLSAITSRATNKDYIDLYLLFQKISLAEILEILPQKLPSLDINLVLKSLVFFEDVALEPIQFKNSFFVDIPTIEKTFKKMVREYQSSRF